MAGLYVETKLRPCYVVGKDSEAKALFHCWSYHSDIYAPSVMVGGHGGGVVARTGAVVELEDGSVTVVRPESIRFVPGIFDEYGWKGLIFMKEFAGLMLLSVIIVLGVVLVICASAVLL